MDLNINTNNVIDQLNKKNFLPGLYIVSTPIGNLADISVRALSLLSLSNLILCEDTRNSKKLIMKYGIKSTLKAFHKFNSTKEIPNILNKLKKGFIVSIISDAGTPLISDPGESIVQKCIDEKILNRLLNVKVQDGAWLNSETVGSIIDRLSIVSLKILHMGIQADRSDINIAQKKEAQTKKKRLINQRNDLIFSLNQILKSISKGTAFYRIYRQFKMYNDPKLNPYLSGLIK